MGRLGSSDGLWDGRDIVSSQKKLSQSIAFFNSALTSPTDERALLQADDVS